MYGIRNEEMDTTVDAACQFQNTWWSSAEASAKKEWRVLAACSDTPINWLVPCYPFQVRDMTLSITLHNFTLGATTKESLISKWIMKSLRRLKSTRISRKSWGSTYTKIMIAILFSWQMRKGKKLATRCLLHCLSPPPPTHTHIMRPCIHVWC